MERRLAAILAADVVGYTRLMGADEAGTLSRLKALRGEIIDPEIARYNGRIVKLMGDGALVEFASVVDAVACAVAIQRANAARDADLAQGERLALRIGVNLGDVIVEGDDIYGDGVNIAARLEGLAEPGSICVSDIVHQSVKGKLDLTFEDIGAQQVKNVVEPVRVYRVRLTSGETSKASSAKRAWRRPAIAAGVVVLVLALVAGVAVWQRPWEPKVELASVERMAFPLPDKPSIAVLPFVNMSDDSEQEYFADGMTEDLITDLSKLRNLFVIARNSSFAYKGKAVDVRQIARELGVRYVMEGSVRKSGDQLRITVQVIDADTGDHLWAERYDRSLKDVFAVQDKIRDHIVTALDVQLADGEQARAWRRTTNSNAAYDLFLRSRELHLRENKEDVHQAIKLLERAVEIDPKFAAGWLRLGWGHFVSASQSWTDTPRLYFEKTEEYAERALELDPSLAEAYTLLGAVTYVFKRDWKKGIALLEKAITHNPNSANGAAFLATFLPKVGRADEAVEFAKKAMRLNPNPPDWYFLPAGRAHLFAGQCEEAISYYRKCVTKIPDFMSCQRDLTAAYMAIGREKEGRIQAREVLRIAPKFTMSGYNPKIWASVGSKKDAPDPLKGQCVMTEERRLLLLYRAGVPE